MWISDADLGYGKLGGRQAVVAAAAAVAVARSVVVTIAVTCFCCFQRQMMFLQCCSNTVACLTCHCRRF